MNQNWSCFVKRSGATLLMLAAVEIMISQAALAQTCTSNPTTTVNTANGQWTLSPAIPTAYQTKVNPPIAADGSSNFAAKRGVIPVQFSLLTAPGSVDFQSIGSDGYSGFGVGTGSNYTDDCSYLSFRPTTSVTFSQLTTLSAVYSLTTGDCHGGSLRWSVETTGGTVLIYYGLPPQVGNGGTGGCTSASPGGANQSGDNLIGNSAIQYDTGGIPGGTYYSNYIDAKALVGNQTVLGVSLVLDSGWQQSDGAGDQKLTLGNVNVSTSAGTGTSDTFSAPTGPAVQTCTLPPAQLQVIKTSGQDQGTVNTVLSAAAADNTGYFRVTGCSYMYNLDVSSLSGSGTYSVSAVINGTPANNPATFMLK